MRVKIKFENNQNFEVLLNKLKSIAKINGENIEYDGFYILELEWLFLAVIDFGYSLSLESKKKLLNKTFKNVIINNYFNKSKFLELLQIEINNHIGKKSEEFFILGSISINYLPFKKIKIGNYNIGIFGDKYPNKFNRHRNLALAKHNLVPNEDGFTKFSVRIETKNFKDAYEDGFYIIEVFRAFLCLLLNSRMVFDFGSQSVEPINKVRNAKFLTLHNSDGSMVDENYFYYFPDYVIPKIFELDNLASERLKINIKILTNQFNKCNLKHQKTIGVVLNMYSDAFDEIRNYTCFIKAWTALELLIDSHQNDTLIKRCLALFDNEAKPMEKQKLESMKLLRNEFVHEGKNNVDLTMACYYII